MSSRPRHRTLELRIGGVTKAELLHHLEHAAVALNAYARTLFEDERFTTSPQPHVVRVAFIALDALGLSDGAPFDVILARAAAEGLAPCPLEVAPHLRLALQDQAEGPYLTVASKKLRSDPSFPNGFYLRRRADGLWLRGYRADPDHVFGPELRDFVFLQTGG